MTFEKVENNNTTIQGKDKEPSIITREKKAAEFMVQIYCKAKHKTKNNICLECDEFKNYAKERIENCPYQAKKPACGVCELSCYPPKEKEKAHKVFTYSGPRMFFKHPIVAIRHIIDAFNNSQKTEI